MVVLPAIKILLNWLVCVLLCKAGVSADLPFNVLLFRVSPHLEFNVSGSKSISVLNYLHIRFSSVF
jgi:hypothetical protein